MANVLEAEWSRKRARRRRLSCGGAVEKDVEGHAANVEVAENVLLVHERQVVHARVLRREHHSDEAELYVHRAHVRAVQRRALQLEQKEHMNT